MAVRHMHKLPREVVVGWGPEQPYLMGGNPPHGRGLVLLRALPTQSIL